MNYDFKNNKNFLAITKCLDIKIENYILNLLESHVKLIQSWLCWALLINVGNFSWPY